MSENADFLNSGDLVAINLSETNVIIILNLAISQCKITLWSFT